MENKVLAVIHEIKTKCELQEGDCLYGKDGCEYSRICIEAFGLKVIANEHSEEDLYKMLMSK